MKKGRERPRGASSALVLQVTSFFFIPLTISQLVCGAAVDNNRMALRVEFRRGKGEGKGGRTRGIQVGKWPIMVIKGSCTWKETPLLGPGREDNVRRGGGGDHWCQRRLGYSRRTA